MEHFLYEAEFEHLKGRLLPIPWLQFDHDTSREHPTALLEQYPAVRGMDLRRLSNIRKKCEPLKDSDLPFFQSWLFFGVWESVFTIPLRSKDFIFESPNGQVIRTRRLCDILKWACHRISTSDHEGRKRTMRLLGYSLGLANYWNSFLNTCAPSALLSDELLDSTIRLTAINGETLLSLQRAFPQNMWGDLPSHNFSLRDYKSSSSLNRRLEVRGWCKSTRKYLIEGLGLSPAEYATLLDPYYSASATHGDCTFEKCIASRIDVDNSRPSHSNPSCECTSIRPSTDAILRAYEFGTFPLINTAQTQADRESSRIGVTPFVDNGETPFLAFSHVWSDGLRGNSEQGLPKCQVSELIKVIASFNDISKSQFRYFYLDTICIPWAKDVKKTAIARMATVYQKATATIVLDSTLKALRTGSCSLAEVCLRILASPWNQRLWTLQEGSITQLLVFAFEDAMCDARELRRRSYTIPEPLGFKLRVNISRFFEPDKTMVSIGDLLRYRMCSEKEDELPAIAPLLGVSAEKLMAYDGLDRSCRFWTSVGTIPSDVIFQPQKKIPRDGFRWAPQTLMGSTERMFNEPEATVTERNGLRASFNLLKLCEPLVLDFSRHKVHFLLDVPKRQFYRLVIYPDECRKTPWDAVIVQHIRRRYHPISAINAVCLIRSADAVVADDIPQYTYSVRAGIGFGSGEEKVEIQWEKTQDAKYIESLKAPVILCEYHEGQELYIS